MMTSARASDDDEASDRGSEDPSEAAVAGGDATPLRGRTMIYIARRA